ncbi:MAG: hypothetical protein IJK96_04155 [Bacteroidales bacterium]|nr:hypothetical protein [Bacteroidales bacterium]
MMKKTSLLLSLALFTGLLLVWGCSQKCGTEFDYETLNARALEDCLRPVHPGARGEVPFWNKYSFKFTYAPVFDFDDVEGAAGYTYTVEKDGEKFSFESDSPRSPLSEIWSGIPSGQVRLSVQAHDGDGNALGEPQTRKFEKDSPFHGPYPEADRGYLESAILGAEGAHRSFMVQNWLSGSEDHFYELNGYPCKIWSATIQNECFLAAHKPELKEEALAVARIVADSLMKMSRPADAPLAYFPPTYYRKAGYDGGIIKNVLDKNEGLTMFVEAVCFAKALLDLYDQCGEKEYFDFAVNIASSYRKLQNEDGSWPVKANYYTGEPFTDAPCMPTTILQLAQRLKDQYGVKGYEEMISRSEKWLWENILATFNFNGQFEDVFLSGIAPFQNLTNCTASDCVDYFLGKKKPSKKEVEVCKEIARFVDDQFTYWNSPGNQFLKYRYNQEIVPFYRPYVYEQYGYRCPIDHSTAGVAMAWMRVYQHTGDPLALAKAKALMDSIILSQDPVSGIIPTGLIEEHYTFQNGVHEIWMNCSYQSITALSRFEKIISPK